MDLVVTCHGRSWGGSWEAPIEGGLGLTAGSWRMAGDSGSEQSRSSLCVPFGCTAKGGAGRRGLSSAGCRRGGLREEMVESGRGGATRFLDGLGFAGRRQLAEGGRLRSPKEGIARRLQRVLKVRGTARGCCQR